VACKAASLSQGDTVKVFRAAEIEVRLGYIADRLKKWDYTHPCAVKLTPYKNPRTLSQNAMFHAWCRQLSKWVIDRDPSYTPDNVKLLLKQKFLGTENIKVGKTVIENQLRHTSSLDTGEMHHFMTEVYHWAFDLGCALEIDPQSEYRKLQQQQVE
jgi:hypothetical protein